MWELGIEIWEGKFGNGDSERETWEFGDGDLGLGMEIWEIGNVDPGRSQFLPHLSRPPLEHPGANPGKRELGESWEFQEIPKLPHPM